MLRLVMYCCAENRSMTSSIDLNMRGIFLACARVRGTLTQGYWQDKPRDAVAFAGLRIPARFRRVCTLAVFHRVFPAYPLVVAANRDEFLARPAAPPARLPELAGGAGGGRDLLAGGTWLGLAEPGLVAGMLNRRGSALPDPTRRSRGLLCLELLGATGARAAAASLRDEPPRRYNSFNLLVADRE